MNVVLISPPYDKSIFRLGESLGLKYLAAVLKQQGINVKIFEPTLLGWDVVKIIDAIVETRCDFLGISIQFGRGLSNAIMVMQGVKDKLPCHISVGGHFATFNYRELLGNVKEIDSIVMYEGEETIVELVKNLKNNSLWQNILGIAYRDTSSNIISNQLRPMLKNINSISFPLREQSTTLPDCKQHYTVLSSRGCPSNCSFCSVSSFYGATGGLKWRARSPKNVVDEIEFLVNSYGATAISFVDDNFLGSSKIGHKRAIQIAEEILNRQLNIIWSFECRVNDVNIDLFNILIKAGLCHVNLGIESGVQTVLDYYNKQTTTYQNTNAINNVRKLGLSVYYHYIMFNPNTTFDELEESLSFIEECGIGCYNTVSTRLDVYKGTQEFYKLEQQKRLYTEGYTYKYHFSDPIIELVFQTVKNGLYPLLSVENYIKKVMFDNQVKPLNNKSSFMNNLTQYSRLLSTKTVEIVHKIIKFFKIVGFVEHKELSCFIDHISKESNEISKLLLNDLKFYND